MQNTIEAGVHLSQFTQEQMQKLQMLQQTWQANGAHEQLNPQTQPKEDVAEFRLEKSHLFDDMSFWNHIVTYLQEYRFQVQEALITQVYSDGYVRDFKGQPMVKMGEDAIKDYQDRGLDTYKVDADLTCMREMDRLVSKAEDGDTLVYGSPPDPVVGYTYGFLYIGHINKISDTEKEIKLRSIRLDKATLQDYNDVITALSGQSVAFSSPNECIEHPLLIEKTKKEITPTEVYSVLKTICNVEHKQEEKQKYKDIIAIMAPRINQYIQFVKSGTTLTERINGFHALEVYALEVKKQYEEGRKNEMVNFAGSFVVGDNDFRGFMQTRSETELEKVSGTCDAVKKRKSANMYGAGSLFDSYNILDEVSDILEEFNSETGKCAKISCSRCKKWTATDAEAEKVQKGEITCCPKCGWKPGESTIMPTEKAKSSETEEKIDEQQNEKRPTDSKNELAVEGNTENEKIIFSWRIYQGSMKQLQVTKEEERAMLN